MVVPSNNTDPNKCKYQFVSCTWPPPQGSTRCDAAASWRCFSVIFFSLRSFGDKIQRHSEPTSKSLLCILHDLRILVDVLANINQSSCRSRVEVLARGDFPNACADLSVTLLHLRHFLVQLAIGVTGDVSWIQQLDLASCIHVCEQIGY
jgi:hypothetical protein